MPGSSRWRWLRWVWPVLASAALIGGLVGLSLSGRLSPSLPDSWLTAAVGGPFQMTSHLGRPFTERDLKGKPFAIFFGFTQCPDVCPTTLLDMSNHLASLGPLADRMSVVFVTVDHERDTAEHLKAYLESFDPRIIGLTGTAEQTAAIVQAYRVLFQKVPTSSGYTINHTATVYLMDSAGGFAGTLSFQEPPETQLSKLKRLVGK